MQQSTNLWSGKALTFSQTGTVAIGSALSEVEWQSRVEKVKFF
jgi:hypothetical protein